MTRLLFFFFLIFGQVCAAADYRVLDQAGLLTALERVSGGDSILLEPGNYGVLDLYDQGPMRTVFDGPVTLRPADPTAPPRFSGLKLTGVVNLFFEGLIFDYTFQAGDLPDQTKPFRVYLSKDIGFKNCLFDGDVAHGLGLVDDGYAAGHGLTLRKSQRVTVEGNKIRGFYRGLVAGESTDIRVIGNELYDLRSDGMNFVKMTGLLVEGNTVRDFRRSLSSRDHADMIQFWSTNADFPTTDVVLRRNFLTVGFGDHTQGILIRNEAVDAQGGGIDMFYRDFVIEDNLILTNHFHGITVGETDGLTVRNNTMIRVPRRIAPDERGAPGMMPGIQVADRSRNVTIEDNVAARVPQTMTQWQQRGNVLVQDLEPLKPGFYPAVFKTPFPEAPYAPKNFAPVTGSVLDRAGVGAPLREFSYDP